MKLCKDCVHCKPTSHCSIGEISPHEWVDYSTARCKRTDRVMGTGEAGRLCVDERAGMAHAPGCGINAGYFEAKP
jgi:hypothetical protein